MAFRPRSCTRPADGIPIPDQLDIACQSILAFLRQGLRQDNFARAAPLLRISSIATAFDSVCSKLRGYMLRHYGILSTGHSKGTICDMLNDAFEAFSAALGNHTTDFDVAAPPHPSAIPMPPIPEFIQTHELVNSGAVLLRLAWDSSARGRNSGNGQFSDNCRSKQRRTEGRDRPSGDRRGKAKKREGVCFDTRDCGQCRRRDDCPFVDSHAALTVSAAESRGASAGAASPASDGGGSSAGGSSLPIVVRGSGAERGRRGGR